MFAPTHPQHEIRRAGAMLHSFTNYGVTANLFDDDPNYDQFELVERDPKSKRTTQTLKAVKPNRQTAERPALSIP